VGCYASGTASKRGDLDTPRADVALSVVMTTASHLAGWFGCSRPCASWASGRRYGACGRLELFVGRVCRWCCCPLAAGHCLQTRTRGWLRWIGSVDASNWPSAGIVLIVPACGQPRQALAGKQGPSLLFLAGVCCMAAAFLAGWLIPRPSSADFLVRRTLSIRSGDCRFRTGGKFCWPDGVPRAPTHSLPLPSRSGSRGAWKPCLASFGEEE